MKPLPKHPIRYCSKLIMVACCIAWMIGIPNLGGQAKVNSSATIIVNTTEDELNSDGDCSLREAIRAANSDTQTDACTAGSGTDTIILSAGTYTLTKVGPDENATESGDLDITSSLTIIGMSTRDSIIDGIHSDRIFEVIGSTTLWLRKMTLRNGKAPSGGSYGGGAILNNTTGTIDLYQVDLRGNSSENLGGALDNAGTARLNYVTLDINQVASESAVCAGGAIYNGGSLLITNSLFSYNTAYNPSKPDYGGGLFNDNTVTLVNVTFSHNTADWGGGLFNQGDEANLYNITFSDNTTAIYNAASLRIKNSIVANSTAGVNCNGDGTISSLGHNIDNGTSCNFELENTDPLLSSLADNLGPTFTHALLAGSPAIDNGDPIDCPGSDQRGGFRPADGDINGSSICDIGAYEYLATLPVLIYLPILGK